ncbi:MAG: dipeptidase [Acidobacteriota bacterium]
MRVASSVTRRWLMKRGAAAACLSAIGPMSLGRYRWPVSPKQPYSARAVELIANSTVIDMLAPFSLGTSPWLRDPDTFTPELVEKFRSSGINVFHIATGVGGAQDPVRDVTRFLGLWNGFIATHTEFLMRVDSPADLEAVGESGKIGVLLGVQNSNHFQYDLDDIDFFYSLGQRVSQLTYNARNRIGNGSTERVDGGLSDYGVAVVKRMNEVGMAVDVSHCGDRTTLDAIEVSEQPVLITHSNARALNAGHPRLKTDEMIEAMAAKGGVMGITGVRMFVRGKEPTTIEDVLDHFDYVARLVGVEHVGLGSDSDLDGYDDMDPEELERLRAAYKDSYGFRDKIDIEGVDHPKRVYDLTEGLIRRGYTDEEIGLILGGNFQRALSQIWLARYSHH